jgi:hypothetical protein
LELAVEAEGLDEPEVTVKPLLQQLVTKEILGNCSVYVPGKDIEILWLNHADLLHKASQLREAEASDIVLVLSESSQYISNDGLSLFRLVLEDREEVTYLAGRQSLNIPSQELSTLVVEIISIEGLVTQMVRDILLELRNNVHG